MTTSSSDKSSKKRITGSTIGEISARLGYDVRDLIVAGYSDQQIDGVLSGKYSLSELFGLEPDGNSRGRLSNQKKE